jgi:hypothetical protein
MTNEERDIISQFIVRVSGGPASSGFASGSVPATQPALPPVDRDADALIAQLFQQYPEARYRITQLAFVQEHALVEAQNRIKRLEWEQQQTQQALQQAREQQSAPSGGGSGGGFFSGLFGGGNRQQSAPPPGAGPAWNQGAAQPQQAYYQPSSPPPQPQYPPNYQQGPLPRQGSGFLGSALTTAAGVAGGMVAGEALMSLFSPHQSAFGGGGFGGGFGGAPGGSPWATPAADQNYVDTGSWNSPAGGGGGGGQDYVDNGSWDQTGGGSDPTPPDDSGSWDSGGGGGGGWDSGSGGSDDTF